MTKKKDSADNAIRDIRRATRRRYSAEEKIRIVLEGLRGESSIAELCRKEGINQNLYYRWSKEFLEAGKKRLAGDTVIAYVAAMASIAAIRMKVLAASNSVEVKGLAYNAAVRRSSNVTTSNTRSRTTVPKTVLMEISCSLPRANTRSNSPSRTGRTLFPAKPIIIAGTNSRAGISRVGRSRMDQRTALSQ